MGQHLQCTNPHLFLHSTPFPCNIPLQKSLSSAGRCGCIPRPQGEPLRGHSLVAPSPVLAPCFWAFATSSPNLCVLIAYSCEQEQTSQQNLPLTVKYKSAACFCCYFWSCRGWENACMRSCKLLAVYLPILMNKEHVLLMTCLCKRGMLSRWIKAVKYEYH